MSCPDINEQINIMPSEWAFNPKFAASCSALFYTFIDNGRVNLRYSEDLGNSFSDRNEIMQLQGPADFLKIAAKDNMAVIVVLEKVNGGIQVRGVTGTITQQGFNFSQCPSRDLPTGSTFNDVKDVLIRINEDGTSDDVVFVQTGAGPNVTRTGHHPHPPQ